jgi:phosphoribosylamine--glycine ligase
MAGACNDLRPDRKQARMKILVVGKGGREHALIRALAESPGAHEMFSFPGSDAISELAEIVEVGSEVEELVAWMSAVGIELCIAGEESYLVKDEGLANVCEKAGIPCWGPHKQSAQLEASKEFAKEFLKRNRIPTGGAVAVDTIEEAHQAIGGKYPVVLKFDGLAAGKGVAVCMEQSEGEAFLNEVLVERRFGEGRMLVEEFLTGPEVSIFAAVVDGHYQIFTPARDYKRIGEGDEGPNTGGMGAVASRQLISAELLERIEREVVEPTVVGLQREGLPYRGFLYFGLMLTPDGPKVIEYNCRFGDPECQAVMPLVKGDLAGYCLAGAEGKLDETKISFDEGWSVCVVVASAGYPEGSRSGDAISGTDEVSEARVYHAGTKKSSSGGWETNGGRVLAVVAGGADRVSAVSAAHAAADKISFDGLQRRRDIGILHFEGS